MSSFKNLVKSTPVAGTIARTVYRALRKGASRDGSFPGSRTYWENRYADGGNSGCGSYNEFAEFKADVLNSFVSEKKIETVIEFGCGDGNQLTLANYPRYKGFDVSTTAVALCRKKFEGDKTKSFHMLTEYSGETADLALSIDVIYHLIEDSAFEDHLRSVFGAATRFAIIYSSDTEKNEGNRAPHVKHRKFTDWVRMNAPEWSLEQHIPNKYPAGGMTQGSCADFYIYRRIV